MNNKKETIPDIIAEFNQELSLDRGHILNYSNRLSAAWRREKDAVRSRIYRFNQKPSVTNTVTDGVTQQKEERSEKENIPPTPPLREKGKKEENASPIGSAVARTSVQARVREANDGFFYGGGVSFECDSRLLQVSQTSSQKGDFMTCRHPNYR